MANLAAVLFQTVGRTDMQVINRQKIRGMMRRYAGQQRARSVPEVATAVHPPVLIT